MKNLLTLIMLISLLGCSSIKPLNSKNDHTDGVEFGESDAKEISPELLPNEETVRLGDRGGDVYRSFEDSVYKRDDIAKKTKVGLVLGPGFYQVTNYIALLKYLEKENLSPGVISGTEFGAIVAAMYASGMTPEVIEWNFYRYFKEKRNHAVFDKEWLREIEEYLLNKINAIRVEDTKIKFYITLYNPQNKKTYFFDKGNLKDLLKKNLTLSKLTKPSSKNTLYTSALESEVLNPRLLTKLGVDFTIGAETMGKDFEFIDFNEYLVGVYSKAYGQVSKNSNKFDFFYNLGTSKVKLDSTDDGPLYLMNATKMINSKQNTLKQKIQEKYLNRDYVR